MHIYAFGSICRGEIKPDSDIDLLAIANGYDERFDPAIYSIYSYDRISELWREGNPFAWHLVSESKMIYSDDGSDFIKTLGLPSEYKKCKEDCLKFFTLYLGAISSISSGKNCLIFELSTIFLAIRNFATCFSLGINKIGNFSRCSALRLGEKSLKITQKTFNLLETSRVLSTRGKGAIIQADEIKSSMNEILSIKSWMENLLREVN
jgi:hypothetical protein